MAFASKKQRIACERNSLKWQLLGIDGNLGSMCGRTKVLTDAEREKLARARECMEDVLDWWNESNTEFGLKNPDLTKENKDV